jgi:2-polyprenyl-3-methyl-5-hydroxy-6-metoxy-1,4-benzoquinol methylase
MIFPENNFDSDLFFKILNKKKCVILDYGCGSGIWNGTKGNKIFLYDKDKLSLKYAKKKYNLDKNFIIISNLKEIKNLKKKIDILLLNSVIQYISKDNLKKLLLNFDKILKKDYKIIISDIPRFNRLIELCSFLFLSPKRFLSAIFIIINFNNYIKKNKFYLNNLDINFLGKNFKFQKIENFNKFKLRYGLVLKKKFK